VVDSSLYINWWDRASGFDVMRPRSVGEAEVEAVEEQGPPGLSRVKSFCRMDVLEVLVIGPDQKGLLGPLLQH